MKYITKYIYLLIIINLIFSSNVWDNKLLFCLKKNIDPLKIIDKKNITNNELLNNIINKYNILNIEPWLNGATEDDFDNDIYLNRIYRITINEKNIKIIEKIKQTLESIDFIHSVEYEFYRKPLFTPNDQYYNSQWFLPDIQSNLVWDLWIDNGLTPGNRDVILASVDLGVNWNHPDLRNNLWQNLGEDADGDGRTIEGSGNNWYLDPGDLNGIDDDDWDNNSSTYIDDLIGWDPSGINGLDDNDPNPPNSGGWSHGTHVAGLLAASTNNSTGISSTAFNCSIMSVKVSTENQPNDIYITDGFDGILYASKAGFFSKGFTIINNSWGGLGYSQYEQSVINTCFNQYNSIIVCAGGNGGDWNSNSGESNSSHYPSGYDNVVSVCPLGTNNSWNHWATYGSTVDLASPGENIRSCTGNNNYQSWDGSSMAAPIAASVFGLVKSYNMDWDNEMIQTMVLETANPIIYDVNTETYLQGKLGKGKVDALSAITTPLFPKLEYSGEDIFIINDNDGEINPGEQVQLSVILYNNSDWGDAVNVSLLLETDDNIEILNENIFIGDIASGEVVINIEEPFNILFSSDLSESNINLNLNIISNQSGYINYNQSYPIMLTVVDNPVIYGDVNEDSSINVLDVVQLVNLILNNTSNLNADLNEDNNINVQDIIILINLILG